MDKITRLQAKKFRFKNAPAEHAKTLGFIAQEVEAVFPDLVQEKRGYKNLKYTDFGILAIAAIKEQQVLIAELKAQVAELVADKN